VSTDHMHDDPDEAQGRMFEEAALTAEEQDERDEAAELADRFATELDELQAERERQIDRAIDERRIEREARNARLRHTAVDTLATPGANLTLL
jgi:hypothetical protein